MSNDLPRPEVPKAFDPKAIEEGLYQYWLDGGYFTPIPNPDREPFTIVIPPPNVTGELHYGHAMFAAFQDLMIRWRRMQGYETLWLPGTDHAGIATQMVVSKELAKLDLTRFDIGREKFIERVWEWKELYGGIINFQMRRLGASCDWTRERFTMDPGLSRAVRHAFVTLYDRGLIYKGTRIINWCPNCMTALSDLEVDHKDVDAKLYYVRYPLVPLGDDSQPTEYITVATTRPETILGDTGVAVNPEDSRYTGLVGRKAILPALGREIPIVADDAVEFGFGTGAVKVTPAHDPVDYEIGLRHNLPAIRVIDDAGRMNDQAGPYAGLDRFACRARLLADLDAAGQLVRIEDYTHSIGHCSRCGTVVEPVISDQWFVKIKPLADPAIEAVRSGEIRFVPDRFARVYFNWMENIRDWCISRQLWWGHRIPVWYCDSCGEVIASEVDLTDCPKCHGTLRQDEDVLDTWFSSGLWPFSTLGWPEKTADLDYFYPTQVMETGYDIIFFWVARMIMFGLALTKQAPFKVVYLHGLLRDAKGEKMSKSKGNVANPLDVIAKYGADALRLTILTGSSPGNDMKLSDDKLEGSRNFVNKLWNAARFVVTMAWDNFEDALAADIESMDLTLEDRWILSRRNVVVAEVTRLFEEYQFSEAGRALHEFVWSEFCDWYIELAKLRLRADAEPATRLAATRVLFDVLDTILRLLHPFAPFVTEAIWQLLPNRQTALIVAPWPETGATDPQAESEMETIIGVVRAIRNLRTEFRIEPARRVPVVLAAGNARDSLAARTVLVKHLARSEPLDIVDNLKTKPDQSVQAIVAGIEVYMLLEGLVDLAAERKRAHDELSAAETQVSKLQVRLADSGFTGKAPAAIVDKERARLEETLDRIGRLRERLVALG